jgi:hypothetical protein
MRRVSSTKAELIAVAEVLPQILWTQYFLEAQGYTCDESIVYQDNKNAILLENNGTASSSKRTRHINIRYYFVTNRIADGELSVAYCTCHRPAFMLLIRILPLSVWITGVCWKRDMTATKTTTKLVY